MFNRRAIRHYLFLLFLSLLLIILIVTLNRFVPSLYNAADAAALAGGVTIAAFVSLLIFFYGFTSDRSKSVFMTLMALGTKLLLSLVLALLFLVVFKNDQPGSVILFFVLYLAFTIYVIQTFIRVLKKSQFKDN